MWKNGVYRVAARARPTITSTTTGRVSHFCSSKPRTLDTIITTKSNTAINYNNIHSNSRTRYSYFSSNNNADPNNKSESEETNPNPEETATEPEDESPPEEDTAQQQAATQVKELKDALMRSLADQENTRRIATRDVADARKAAIKSFAKALLDVSDNLERAMAAVPESALLPQSQEEHNNNNNSTNILSNLYQGIALTERGLLKAFEANGLKKFGQAGEAFDPNRHDALMEYADETKEPGTIGQVMKVGFLLNERVLRPAEVGVIKKQE